MTPERRVAAWLNDRTVRTVHLSRTLRRRIGISKKAAEKNPRLRVHDEVPGLVAVVVREGRRNNVELFAYDAEGERFARTFAERPIWSRLGL